MNSFWNSSVDASLSAIASASPTPGGGAASSLSAAIGLALVRMAVAVSMKSSSVADEPTLASINEALLDIGNQLKEAANEDMDAFNKYMVAIKLPKGSSELDEARNKAIDIAVEAAIEAPLRAAELITTALEKSIQALPFIKETILSDLFAGAVLLNAACVAIQLNVDVNANSKRLLPRKAIFQHRKTKFANDCEGLLATIQEFGVERGYRFKAADLVK